jgi:hypothetical protein
VKNHPPRNRSVQAAICKRKAPSVTAHRWRPWEICLKPGKHPCRAVETNDAMAYIHKRLSDRHAGAATDIRNARMGGQPGRDGKRFSDAESPAAIGLVPVGNRIVFTHARCI